MSAVIESEDQKQERLRKELEGKNVQFYMALATAWITTKTELDKTIITLSAGAIGLLITVLTAKGVAEGWHIGLFVISFIGYLIAIFTSLFIFQKNSKLIEAELREEEHNIKLERYDKLARWSFFIGTVAFVAIGIFSALSKWKEVNQKKEEKPQANQEIMKPAEQPTNELKDKIQSPKKNIQSGVSRKSCKADTPPVIILNNYVQSGRYSSCRVQVEISK